MAVRHARSLAIGALCVLALIAVSFAVSARIYFVPTVSMRPTLEAGDIVLCIRYSVIRRGDLVVFESPSTAEKAVKRVIGLSGDKVAYAAKELVVNGEIAHKTIERKLSGDDQADLLLAQNLFGKEFRILENFGRPLFGDTDSEGGGYFVLGDNRDDSVDSRDYGRLDEKHVQCRAIAKLGSTVSGVKDARWL